MKNLIILFLLLNYAESFAQIRHEKAKLLSSETIKLDTIEVKIFVYKDRVVTESYFEKSKSKLNISYLKIDKSFAKIVTRENSSMPEYLWRTNEFDFKDGKVSNGKERLCFSGKMHGIIGNSSEKEYGKEFNKTLETKFVEKYVVELFEKIKNYR